MTCNELIENLVNNSGLTHKEIANKCKEYGEPITANYISILKNDPSKTPSDNVGIALAKACGAKYENIIVVQAYIDRAPNIIKQFLEYIYHDNMKEKDLLFEAIEERTGAMQTNAEPPLTLAEFICDYIKEKEIFPTSPSEEFNKLIELIDSRIEKRDQKNKDWLLINLNENTTVKYLSNDELTQIKKES